MAIKLGNGGADEAAVTEFELQAQGFDAQANEVAETTRAARVVAFQESADALAEAGKIGSIVERAKIIADEVQFSDVRKVRMGDMFIAVPENTDTNKRIVLDYLFKHAEKKPHFDLYRGRIVDHADAILDDFYDGTDCLDAFNAVGLRKLKLKEAIDAVRAYALRHRYNDLTRRLESMIPEWDGVVRMPHSLVAMFDSADTELNRDFGMYFWLSLYCRCMFPGEEAPIVLTLIGAQGCGKSYFGKLLARMITGDVEADSVQLDLSGSKVEFLREITGNSVVASVGEMTGFNRGDLNRIKDFITRTHDKFHHKFEGVVHQPRQWITVMDSNRYEGLLRDDTGNRRFYPLFCGQLPDVAGKQQWRQDYQCDFTSLRANLWQIFAEARAWIDVHGMDRYRDMVRAVSKQVFDFSLEEMAQDRGTITDDVFDIYLVQMLKDFPHKFVWKRKVGGATCVGIKTGEFRMFFQDTLRHVKPYWKHLKPKILALGGIEHMFTGGYAGYIFPAIKRAEDFDASIGVKEFEADGYVEGEKSPVKRMSTTAGGF